MYGYGEPPRIGNGYIMAAQNVVYRLYRTVQLIIREVCRVAHKVVRHRVVEAVVHVIAYHNALAALVSVKEQSVFSPHKDKIAFAFAKFFFNVFKLVFKRGTAHKKPVAQLVNILRRRQIEQFKHKVAAESGIGTHAAAREYPPERRFVRRRYAIPFASFRYQLYVLPIQQTAKLRKPAADRSVAYLHFLSKLCGGKPVIGLQKIQ